MPVSVRSYLTAGVALAGAGAIALSPISPVNPVRPALPDIQVASSADVELSAVANPLETWAQVFEAAFANGAGLAATVVANPAPILGNIAGNQLITARVLADLATTFGSGVVGAAGEIPESLQSAVQLILDGDIQNGVAGLATAFLMPVIMGALPILMDPDLFPNVQAVLRNPLVNALAVVDTVLDPMTLVTVGLPLLMEVISPVAQIGVTGQALYDAVQAGDFEAAVSTVLNAPAEMVNTVLNGSSNPFIGNSGVLGEGGLVASLLGLRQSIADAMTPPPISGPEALRESAGADIVAAVEREAPATDAVDPGALPTGVLGGATRALTLTRDVGQSAVKDAGAAVVSKASELSGSTDGATSAERKAQRAEARAERQAQRAEAKAERQAQRQQAKAERQAKRAEARTERQSQRDESASGNDSSGPSKTKSRGGKHRAA